MEKLHWTQCQHACHVQTRWWSGGWEFETATKAREYVAQSFGRYSAADMANTPFRFEVATNGLEVHGYVSTRSAQVCTRTYAAGATMRDRTAAAGPSDCVWLIPGSEW